MLRETNQVAAENTCTYVRGRAASQGPEPAEPGALSHSGASSVRGSLSGATTGSTPPPAARCVRIPV